MVTKLFLFTVFFLTLLQLSSTNIQILKYETPGTYILSPNEYSYSDNIIIELWGGGSGGSTNYGFRTKYAYEYKGGSSSSYIKANLITLNETFKITVGNGGLSCASGVELARQYYCQGDPGKNSIIENENIYLTTNNFQIYYKYDYFPYEDQREIVMKLNIERGFLIDSIDPIKGDTILTAGMTNNLSKGVVSANSYKYGKGADCCFIPENSGNNGGVIIYFDSFLSPTITATRSVTISPSLTSSATPSPSFSASKIDKFDKFYDTHTFYFWLIVIFFVLFILLCVLCLIGLIIRIHEKRKKIHYKTRSTSEKGRCCLCLKKCNLYECNYNHGTCKQCLNSLDERYRSLCPMCDNVYLDIY